MKLVTQDYTSEMYPRITWDNEDFREGRLMMVCGFLRARLTEEEFAAIYRVHDHKGHLMVGISRPKPELDCEKIEREVEAAWESMNEYDFAVYYTPDWHR